MLRFVRILFPLWISTLVWVTAPAAESPFASGWTLQPDNSVLNFQSIKNGSKFELSSFLNYGGNIDANGQAVVRIQMDSVETRVDLQNVRMRFLLFETFDYPVTTITMDIPETVLADLTKVRRKKITLPFRLELVGLRRDLRAEMIVTLIDYNTVAVASAVPILISADVFGLSDGVSKLEDSSEEQIVPAATVSFNFAFGRNTSLPSPTLAALASTRAPDIKAIERTELSLTECRTRLEVVSRSGRINFETNSAKLGLDSHPILNTLKSAIERCPSFRLQISGHTDSSGNAVDNQRLSENRARAVMRHLVEAGLQKDRLTTVGFGQTQPIAENETVRGRTMNRRIEFNILSGT